MLESRGLEGCAVSSIVSTKLEWPLLIEHLAKHARTEEARSTLSQLAPTRTDASEIRNHWNEVNQIKIMIGLGYRPPIAGLTPMGNVLRALELGQILDGDQFREIFSLLSATKALAAFAIDFMERSTAMRHARSRLYPLPKLYTDIERAVGPDGQLLETASPELQRIRRQRVALRKRIEEQLRKILHTPTWEPYIQDDFFTVRAERYVVPISLDGRGRMEGKIYDASDSGQTLFIEPTQVTAANDQLLELEIAEKLEVLRIFQELSAKAAQELEHLEINYREIVRIDVLSAEASFADEIDAGPVELAEHPSIRLVNARHPLLSLVSGKKAVANSVDLENEQRCLIISGPNAGGKTIVLKTVGLVTLMAKAGLLVPADPESSIHLFKDIHVEMGDAQSLAASLSTFSGHLLGLKPILERAGERSLVLLDELAVGTEPNTGSGLAQAILEHLAKVQATTVCTTHFEALKNLATSSNQFRNGSMEYLTKDYRPTYRLILDVPGQSYGLEVAQHLGLSASLIERAKVLRGTEISSLESAVERLNKSREEFEKAQVQLKSELLLLQQERDRHQAEVKILANTRQKVAADVRASYEGQLRVLRDEFEAEIKALRAATRAGNVDKNAIEIRQHASEAMQSLESKLNELASAKSPDLNLPGVAAKQEDILVGRDVYVLPVRTAGKIVRVADDFIEVQVGVAKLRVSLHDLRIVEQNTQPAKPGKAAKSTDNQSPKEIGLVLQNPTNSIDLRGYELAAGIDAAFGFIDRALLRGEPAVILIHGHGTDRLKNGIRHALRHDCPYAVDFRPGSDSEGGDGVTVVELRS